MSTRRIYKCKLLRLAEAFLGPEINLNLDRGRVAVSSFKFGIHIKYLKSFYDERIIVFFYLLYIVKHINGDGQSRVTTIVFYIHKTKESHIFYRELKQMITKVTATLSV